MPIIAYCMLEVKGNNQLSCVREEWLRTYNNTAAAAYGLEKMCSVITSAALPFVVVTSAFTFTK